MHAYANPEKGVTGLKDPLNNGAAGHDIVQFNKKDHSITMECWPRFVDGRKPDAEQFTG